MQAKEDADRLLFENEDGVDLARAFLVYSIVPYLGIIFVPFAFATAVSGHLAARRRRDAAARTAALISMLSGGAILAVQILLWWLLYYVPTLHRQY